MQVRGAPLIGITAAFGLAHAVVQDPTDESIQRAYGTLLATRPTAVNLRWALDLVLAQITPLELDQRARGAVQKAVDLRAADIAHCESIGANGLEFLNQLYSGDTVNVMTHCNAGWLATIQWGTALAPIYKAFDQGLPVHVWVSETRPRNQGMNLTAWELQRAGIPYTLITDNSCGQLMQQGKVDCVIVGSDRTAANGDVCNKVGTYMKALAASANSIPFYVALPTSTIDWHCESGKEIPIEERESAEILKAGGMDEEGNLKELSLAPEHFVTHNPAFDVTPAELVSALITEEGVCSPDVASLLKLRDKVLKST